MAAAIQVDQLSKRYRISHDQRAHAYGTLRDTLGRLAAAPLRWLRRGEAARQEEFWALKDVSFDVQPGEIVGVIGRNGAGKSTLLKILSRITRPTEGQVAIRGRVRSLLEVGTGFHPELTGRENVFLNGALLGMGRREIQRKLDEIVAFAEIEQFLDTPVKRYSSGMYLRLAFSVSAHLEADILIIDEALSVGDAGFQRKCQRKMHDLAQEGRTVLFVSHGMGDVKRLCQRAILLVKGRVRLDGPAPEAVDVYLNYLDRSGTPEGPASVLRDAGATWECPSVALAPGNEVARALAVRVLTEDGRPAAAIDVRNPVAVEMEYEVLAGGHVLVPNYHFYNDDSICVFVVHDCDPAWRGRPRPAGRYRSAVRIPGNFFNEGRLTVSVAVSTHHPAVAVHFSIQDAVSFMVVDSRDADTARGDYAGRMPGVVRPLLPCTTELTEPAGRAPAFTDQGALA